MVSRQLDFKMAVFIDDRLKDVGLAQRAILQKDARALFIEAARCCYGIREQGGNNSGPTVELIQETVGGHSREAWCMSFVQTCLAYVEEKLKVKSPILVSEHCLTVWSSTPKEQRVKFFPLPGAIAIWRHGSSSNGHTGIVLGADDKTFHSIEGNTEHGEDPNGKVVRDGGGVYFLERSMHPTGDMKLVGFLKPF